MAFTWERRRLRVLGQVYLHRSMRRARLPVVLYRCPILSRPSASRWGNRAFTSTLVIQRTFPGSWPALRKWARLRFGHANAGVTFDLEKLISLPEASVHVIFEERNGRPNNGGTDLGLNQNAGPVKYRLSQFYWEQGFLNDHIDIEVGRIEPTLEFAFSDLSCITITDIICTEPATWFSQNKNGAYPATEWGGRVNLTLTPQIYFKIGAYQDTPVGTGFMDAGFDWRTAGSTGALIPVELGYLTGFGDVKLPSKYDVGYWRDTSQFTKGNQVGNPTVSGRDGLYLQLQQTIWRPDPKTNQSITLFGGAIWYDQSPAYNAQYTTLVFMFVPLGVRCGHWTALLWSALCSTSINRPPPAFLSIAPAPHIWAPPSRGRICSN